MSDHPKLDGEVEEAQWMIEHLRYMHNKALADKQPDVAKLCEIQPEDTVFGIASGSISSVRSGGECLCLGISERIVFKPKRLLIVCHEPGQSTDDTRWASGIFLRDVKIGKESMFKNENEIDTSRFAPTSTEASKIILYGQVEQMRVVGLFFRSEARGRHIIIRSAFVGLGKQSSNYKHESSQPSGLPPSGYSLN